MLESTTAPPANEGNPALKLFREGTDRAASPTTTLERVIPFMAELGITRIADITGLDRIGLPVMTAFRPNGRSVSVSQGKGLTEAAARASALMESLETHHAEHATLPLLLESYRELGRRSRVVDVRGLPRLSVSCFQADLPLLWTPGVDMLSGGQKLLPYESVHLDFRVPLPTGSGAFLIGSNGLASGNHLLEAMSHAICELVERDANMLWHLSPARDQDAHQLDMRTIDDEGCRSVLDRFENAGIALAVWETTSDIGIPAFLCTIVDRDRNLPRRMPPITGSGCHPRRHIALLRALTEAAQGRLTTISGSRDDISLTAFDHAFALSAGDHLRQRIDTTRARRSFRDVPDVDHGTFDEDVQWEVSRLAAAGLQEVVVVNLTRAEIDVPVVRVVIPYLEATSEIRGYVPGARARRKMTEVAT